MDIYVSWSIRLFGKVFMFFHSQFLCWFILCMNCYLRCNETMREFQQISQSMFGLVICGINLYSPYLMCFEKFFNFKLLIGCVAWCWLLNIILKDTFIFLWWEIQIILLVSPLVNFMLFWQDNWFLNFCLPCLSSIRNMLRIWGFAVEWNSDDEPNLFVVNDYYLACFVPCSHFGRLSAILTVEEEGL